MATDLANRDGKTVKVPLAELRLYYRNARRGDVGAVVKSLLAYGQYKPITVNAGTKTGRPNEVLAGNHTLRAFRQISEDPEHAADPYWKRIECRYVDVDNPTAEGINVVDNRTSDLAEYDNAVLLEQLSAFDPELLESVSYTSEDLEALRAAQEDGEFGTGEKIALWGSTLGDPEVTPDVRSVWAVGRHVLVVASVHRDWPLWASRLTAGMLFAPYPSLLAPYTDVAAKKPLLMVQPDRYIAGWLLTKWNRLNPDDPARETRDQ